MTDLSLWKHAPAFPLRTGRTTVKQQLGDHTDPLVGVVQCGDERLIGSKVSLLVPFQMAAKQVQGIVVSRESGSFR
jgi:hypothetical protein